MDMELLKNNPGLVHPTDHIVLLYEDERDVISPVVNFLHASLRNNNKCAYISGDTDTAVVIRSLKELPDFDRYVKRGQLLFIDKNELYSKNGRFHPDKMIELIISEAEAALSAGFEGISFTGEISWVLDFPRGHELIIEYEWKLNEYVHGSYPVSSICRYNLNKFPNDLLIDVIQTHPLLIFNEQLHENPFYIQPEGYRDGNISKHQVKAWLSSIGRFTNEKSRFTSVIKDHEKRYNDLQLKLANNIILAMTSLLDIHDSYTRHHSENVAGLSKDLAKSMRLTKGDVDKAYLSGLVHDIGKTLIANEIINKRGPLDDGEMEIIKKHPVWAYEALTKTGNLADIAVYVLHHHERWDGGGYPAGLKGEEIPLVSRILAVADAYDAMTQDRPYRKAMSIDAAMAEITNQAGRQFAPDVCRAFIKMHALRPGMEVVAFTPSACSGAMKSGM